MARKERPNTDPSGRVGRRAGLTMTLLMFWLLLAGRIDVQTVSVGLVVCSVVAWASAPGFPRKSDIPASGASSVWLAARFVGRFLIEIVLANIEVAKIVLNPALPVEPQIVRFKTRLKKPVSRVILANAITLTPGTLTVDIEGDEFVVHALTSAAGTGVADWVLESILVDMEEGERQ